MSKKVAIIISPNWRDYGKKYLADCLESVRKQDWTGESKIFLIDNESSEESYGFMVNEAQRVLGNTHPGASRHLSQEGNTPPFFEIIRNKNNDGFARGNNVAMQRALDEGFDYIILFNMDTEVDQSAVSELVKMAESDEKIGAVQARLMLYSDKNKINSLGNQMHFLGFGYCEGFNLVYEKSILAKSNKIFYPSGASVLYRAAALKEIGLFDEEFWMYGEDLDLGWRLWLGGWRCVLAPEAVVYHKYEFSRSIRQIYWMNRNRLLAILKNYHGLTLAVLAPAMLLMEFFLLIVSVPNGWWRDAGRLYSYFLRPRTWRYLASSRREVQKRRKIKDREIARLIIGEVKYQEINSGLQAAGNFFFNLYWQIIKRIIVW